jgi:hypothetical protein
VGEGPVSLWWKLKCSGEFNVSTCYEVLRGSVGVQFPGRSIWGRKILKEIAFFVWSATLGEILIVDNLIKRNAILVGWCWVCK